LESRESNNRKNTIGINSTGFRPAGGKTKRVDATLGINNKTKKMLNNKSPTISTKRSIISMNKKAVENMSEMNKQMKKSNKKTSPMRQKKLHLVSSPVSPIAPAG
jgi:predicted Ser/Thr protein kinase